MVASGSRVRVHYIGRFDDGTQFDSSYEYGETLEFVVGGGHMIVGFDAAVAEMELGEKRTIRIEPHEGYGEWREDFVEKVPCDLMPGWELLPIGQPVAIQTQAGQTIEVTCMKVEDGFIYLDHNHFLAGKPLTFDIELVEVLPAGSSAFAGHAGDCGCGCGGHDHASHHEHDGGCGCGCHC